MESMETLRLDFERQSKLFMLALEEERGGTINPQQEMKRQQEMQRLEVLPRADIAAITKNIETTAATSNNLATKLSIMRTLHFDGMELRRFQVTEAHTHTYSWAYLSNFSEWMVSEDPLLDKRETRLWQKHSNEVPNQQPRYIQTSTEMGRHEEIMHYRLLLLDQWYRYSSLTGGSTPIIAV
ncbi:hypothetical protein PENSUB_8190 [Penicillium subrubescens]|uniref:Uncharacterized protein n=1 Tax=Penicillium subrubescens TaxID=1316194 RepID=A0A1Q5TIC9_9EURO|nr:hypothetical protein PENSUB_8190 [Penicillium subrubescens]